MVAGGVPPALTCLDRRLLGAEAAWTTAVELGAGTGLLGVAAACVLRHSGLASLLLTDVAAVVPDLEANVALNAPLLAGVAVRACALDWTQARTQVPALQLSAPVDLLLAADVVWVEHLVQPLVDTMQLLATDRTLILFAHQTRSQRIDDIFFAALTAAEFSM